MAYREKLPDGTTRITGQTAAGTPGPPGPAGPPAPAYIQEQTFASALNDWIMTVPSPSKALSAYAQNTFGDPLKGDVTYPDDTHVKIHFYYPQTGLMRVYN